MDLLWHLMGWSCCFNMKNPKANSSLVFADQHHREDKGTMGSEVAVAEGNSARILNCLILRVTGRKHIDKGAPHRLGGLLNNVVPVLSWVSKENGNPCLYAISH